MKILVAGSSGFIGSHLTQFLSDRGHELVGLDLAEPKADYGLTRFVKGDVRKPDKLLEALEGVDAMINLAAVHFDFGHTEQEYFETNESGTKTVLEALKKAGVSQFLFTSSIAVYGDRTDEANESTTPAPTSPYGASKLGGEQHIRQWSAEDPNRRVVVLRPCVVYGERNVTNMRNLIRQIDSGFFILFGSGKNVKATAYVGNLINAIAMHIEDMQPGLIIQNYADKPDQTVSDVVSIIRTELGKSKTPLKMPLWLGILAAIPFEAVTKITGKNLPVSIARVKKLAQPTRVAAQRVRDAGFQQPVSSDEGLRRMVRDYLQNK